MSNDMFVNFYYLREYKLCFAELIVLYYVPRSNPTQSCKSILKKKRSIMITVNLRNQVVLLMHSIYTVIEIVWMKIER